MAGPRQVRPSIFKTGFNSVMACIAKYGENYLILVLVGLVMFLYFSIIYNHRNGIHFKGSNTQLFANTSNAVLLGTLE